MIWQVHIRRICARKHVPDSRFSALSPDSPGPEAELFFSWLCNKLFAGLQGSPGLLTLGKERIAVGGVQVEPQRDGRYADSPLLLPF